MSEAKNPMLKSYPSFNLFFTRALKASARPMAKSRNAIVSPVDGRISEVGTISTDTIIQAKQYDYSVQTLLGGNPALANRFHDGSFINIYLSPSDYHRIHMPITGELESMIYVPGRLFSVSPSAVRNIPQLFTRNERVISIFKTELGCVAMVKVGALFVSSIDTVWHGPVTPRRPKTLHWWDYEPGSIRQLQRGEEAARFNMGSTVILLFEPGKLSWQPELAPHRPIKLGELIATAL